MTDLNTVSGLKVLFVGDTIVDEYIYVRTIGKAVKENALSAIVGDKETFYGGVWAAANHTRNFVYHVDLLVGEKRMINTRIVDEVYLRKLFVMHKMVNEIERRDPVDVGGYDLVVVCDFGHGTMTPQLIERLTREARYLAVNTQTNATNFGFNLITKYPRADLVVLDELEARLAVHERDADIEDVILKLDRLGYHRSIVTRGIHGAIGFDGAFERQEALTDKVTDTMGAGDAFLAVAAPFAAVGASLKTLIKVGNAAGAVKVGIVGHRSSVTKEALEKYINAY